MVDSSLLPQKGSVYECSLLSASGKHGIPPASLALALLLASCRSGKIVFKRTNTLMVPVGYCVKETEKQSGECCGRYALRATVDANLSVAVGCMELNLYGEFDNFVVFAQNR